MKEDNNMFLVPSKFRFTTKEKCIMIVIIILMIISIIVIWIQFKDVMLKNAQYEAYRHQIEQEEQEKKQIAEKRRQEKLPQLTENGKENIKHIYSADNKRAFITFDDGPSDNTNQILDILKEKNIKATFFVLGSNVEKNPELVKRIYDEGHFIANHGYSHKYNEIYNSVDTVIYEYNKTEQCIKNALDNQNYNSRVFRFPGGSVGGKYNQIKQEAKEVLKQNNVAFLDWNALSNDSAGAHTKEDIMDNITKTVGEKNNVVILMHDASDKILTYETLQDVINFLKNKGYMFKNLYDVL